MHLTEAWSWRRRPAFRLNAFVAVRQDGDVWMDEAGAKQIYHLRGDFQVGRGGHWDRSVVPAITGSLAAERP